ncbi:BNR-4 repeat-containing protein [Rhizobium phaseoli]|uniref:BNR-4 repeat-containing protein n=1 Tax=Rhizobium phaseoli TaxID=396 RepID=UPI0014855BBF|nr:BNR-4 repeat-containing protein [Rhizobium phaseoli]
MAGLKTSLRRGVSLAALIALGGAIALPGGGGGTPVAPFNAVTSLFADNCAMGPWYALSTTPPIIKAANGDVWASYQGFDWVNGAGLENKVRVYSNGVWGPEYPALLCDSSTDNHGGPAQLETTGAYKHNFGGTHNGPMRHAVTTTPGDPSTFVRQADIGNNFTYPHPTEGPDGNIHLLMRKTIVAEDRMPLVVVKSTAMVNGIPTWGAEKELISLDADSRYYQGGMVEIGTEVHMTATRANTADTERRNVYYVIYDKADGTIYNHDKSVSVVAASQPINLTTMNASFRIVDQVGAGTFGQIPSLAIDAAGNKHIAYLDGSGATRAVKVISIVGGAIGAPVTIDTVANNQASVCLRKMDDGQRLELAWAKENGNTYLGGGGDIWRAVRSAAGVWSSPAKIAAATKMYAYSSITPVYKGSDDLAFAFGEIVGTSTTDVENGYVCRAYMYGSNGFVARSATYDTDAQNYFNAMDVQESDSKKAIIDAFFKVLKAINKYNAFETIHFGGVANEQAALLDLTGRHEFTAVGSPAFVPNEGFDPDGVDDYINLGFNPSSTPGLKIVQTGFAIMEFVLDEGQEANASMGTLAAASPTISLVPRNTSDVSTTRLNDGTSLNGANTTAYGFYLARRTGSTKELYKNRTRRSTTTTAATGTANGDATLFRSGAGHSNKRAPFAAWATASFSQLSEPAMCNAVVRLLLESGIISADVPD